MPYKIKYSNELKHHGILGMKWGVWNDETRQRYFGNQWKKNVLDSDIKNYGKKGAKDIAKRMQRKNMSRNASRRYQRNIKDFGEKGAKRIEKRIKKGDKVQVAEGKEYMRILLKSTVALAVFSTIAFNPELAYNVADKTLDYSYDIAFKGMQFVDDFMLNHGLGKYSNIINAEYVERRKIAGFIE